MKKVKQFIKGVVLSVLILGLFFGMLIGAFLQQSYRLNPPTDAEIEQWPFLEKYRR